jgi:uncharacterized protein YegP (UPF0339 family)
MYQFRIVRSSEAQPYRVHFMRDDAVLLHSAGLPTRASAKTYIAAIKLNAASAEIVDFSAGKPAEIRGFRFEIVPEDDRGYFVRLCAGDNILVRSESYTVKRSAQACIASVRSNGAIAAIIDESEEPEHPPTESAQSPFPNRRQTG